MGRKSGLAVWWNSRHLKSLKGEERLQAVEKLASLGSDEAVPLLIEALSDSLTAVRQSAAAALGEIEDDRAIRPLIELLLHERVADVRHEAAAALGHLDRNKTTPILLSALDDHDLAVCQAAAWALQTIAWDRLDEPERARVSVIQCDWEYAATLGRPAIPALEDALRTGTQRARRDAVEAMAQIGGRDAFAAVVGVLRDTAADEGAREAAAWALRQYVWPDLEDSDLALAAIVAGDWAAIEQVGPSAVGPLCSALQDPNTHVRERAAEALGRLEAADAINALTLAIRDPNQDIGVRTVAAEALGHLPGDRQIPALAEALNADGWPVRRAAAAALAKTKWQPSNETERAVYAINQKDWETVEAIGTPAARPLVRVLKYHAVSGDAARVLVRLGQPGVDAMVELLDDPDAEPALREVASTVLAEIGDERAIDPLHEMLAGSDIAIRHTAVWALERLGWEPKTDADRALVAIARDDWAQVCKLGPAAVRPLTNLLRASLALEEAGPALQHILETMAGRIEEVHLRELADLPDPRTIDAGGDTSHATTYTIVRQLADRELRGRGLAP